MSHHLPSDDHPAARAVGRLGEALAARGHHVAIHASRTPTRASGGGGSPPRGERRPAAWRRAGWFLGEIARDRRLQAGDEAAIDQHRPDVIFARQDAYRWSMMRAARRRGVPAVVFADAPVAHEARRFPIAGRHHPPQLVEAIERRGLQAGKAVVVVSGPAAELLGAYRLDLPIHVIPNGVDPDSFPERALNPDGDRPCRTRWGLTAPTVLGFVGTFRAFHGLQRLGELVQSTRDRDDVQWLIVGDGPGRGELEMAARAAMRPTVFTGRVPPGEVPGLLRLIDVAVAPHPIDPLPFYFCPLKLIEAAAAGCAVMATAQGDIPRLLGDAAVLVGQDSREAWTTALASLILDPDRRRALGSLARRRVLDQFTWDQAAERLQAVLAAALGGDLS